ncbi:MAG: TonB-dependent receptor [Sphingomonadaceae bacterium]
MRAISRSCASILAVTLYSVWATNATAQEDTESSSGVSAGADQEIIVSARKRDERLQDVPAAITAVGAQEMERYSTNTLSQISTRVPQLVIGNVGGPGGASINLRGIGSPGTSPSVDQAVSINIDGVQVSQGNAVNLGIYDLERTEVLKGPQAMFYGKNSIGGIISLVSADPGDEVEWMVRSGYEFKEKRKQVEAMVSAPLTDSLGLRLIGAYGDQEGWFRNRINSVPGGASGVGADTVSDQRDMFLRGTLKFDSPADDFEAKLKVAYSKRNRDNGVASGNQMFSCPLGAPQMQVYSGNTGGINDCTLDRIVVEPAFSAATLATAPYYYDGYINPFFTQDQFLGSLQMVMRPSDALTITTVSAYYKLDEHWSYNASAGEVETLATAGRVGDEQFSQEIRLASSFDSPFNFVAGAYFQDAKKRFDGPLIFNGYLAGGAGPLLFTDDRYRQKTNASSFFLQGILTLSEQFELTAGGRYSHEKKTIRGKKYPSALTGFAPGPVDLIFTPDKLSFNDFSPEITARYRPSQNVTIYAAYREGFTSGGFNMAPGFAPPPAVNDVSFSQAQAKGGEIGMKGSVLDRQLSFDLSVYSYKYKNLQLNSFDPVSIAVKVNNAGSSRSKGAEASLAFSPYAVPGLTLRSSVAYNRSRYLSYPTAPCYAGQSIAQGCNLQLVPRFDPVSGAPIGSSYSAQDLSGTQVERAPEWTMSHGFNWDLPVSDSLTISFGGDANFTDSFNPEPSHNPRAGQKSVWRFNGFVSAKGADDGWELSLVGRNLTNALRFAHAFEYPTTGAAYPGYATPGLGADLAGGYTAPRTILLQLTLRSSLLD